jgi:predicted DNA-binding protein
MPTQKPRIALTVPDDVNDLLERVSELTGTPKSKLIVEMLEQYSPILEQVLSALEQIKADKEKGPEIAKKFANEMLLDVTSMVGDFSKEVKKL